MESVAGWIAPAATMLAALMTAANLGARITGWGFVVFVMGSISWSIVGISSGQTNLLWTNGFLTIVNVFGVWRWLGRQAKYEDGGAAAAQKSSRARVPSLFSTAGLIGMRVVDRRDRAIGTVIDAMATCDGATIAYVVVSEGGVGGIGERLHALDPATLKFGHDGVRTLLDARELASLPVLNDDCWPERLGDADQI